MSEDLEEKGELMNESISDEGDCRTAPATPGLLIICSRVEYSAGSISQLGAS